MLKQGSSGTLTASRTYDVVVGFLRIGREFAREVSNILARLWYDVDVEGSESDVAGREDLEPFCVVLAVSVSSRYE